MFGGNDLSLYGRCRMDPAGTKKQMLSQQPPKPATSALKRLAEFFGLRRSIVGLLGMIVLVGMGERLAERFLPVYLIALGGGFISVGMLNGLTDVKEG